MVLKYKKYQHFLHCYTYIYTYANILQPIWVKTWIICYHSTMTQNYLFVDLILILVCKISIHLFSKLKQIWIFTLTGALRQPMFSLCCKSLLACQQCLEHWYTVSTICPRCQMEGFEDASVKVAGLDDALTAVNSLAHSDWTFLCIKTY